MPELSLIHISFESVYLSLDDQVIVEEGGYMEFPYLVTRFLKWGSGPYGLAPGRDVYKRQAQDYAPQGVPGHQGDS